MTIPEFEEALKRYEDAKANELPMLRKAFSGVVAAFLAPTKEKP